MLISSEQNYPHQILLNGGFVRLFKLIYAYTNKGDKVCECYSCLKMMIQAHLHVGFFKIFLIKRASFKQFYLYTKQFYLFMKLLQSSTPFKQKYNQKIYSKKMFATLCIAVTMEKSELTFLLIWWHSFFLVHLTLPPHIIFVQVKSGACYITGQWGGS